MWISPFIWAIVLLFVVVCLCFELSLGFYNGFLPEIASRQTINRVSAWGYALGYLGGALALILAMLVTIYGKDLGLAFDLEERRAAIRWSHEYWAGDRAVIRYDRERLGKEAFLETYLRQILKVMGVDHQTGDSEEVVVTKIVARFREEFSPEPYLEPGAKELLWNLREAGFTLGLVSNRDEPLTGVGAFRRASGASGDGPPSWWRRHTSSSSPPSRAERDLQSVRRVEGLRRVGVEITELEVMRLTGDEPDR